MTGAATQPLTLPESIVPGDSKLSLTVGTFHSGALPAASGGVQPYTYSFTCAGGQLPSGMGFAPATRVFAGTPGARFRDSCTYTVTDSAQPAATVSVAVEVEVTGSTDTLSLPRPGKLSLTVGTFPQRGAPGCVRRRPTRYTYSFTCAGGQLPSGMGFAPATRVFAGHPGRPLPRFVHVHGHGQRTARRDGLRSRRGRGDRFYGHPLASAPWQAQPYRRDLSQRGAPGCVRRRPAVHILLHLCRGTVAVRDGLRARDPRVRRHPGRPLPRFVHVHGHGQRTARRDGLRSRRGPRSRAGQHRWNSRRYSKRNHTMSVLSKSAGAARQYFKWHRAA